MASALLHWPTDLTLGLHLRTALQSIGRDLAQTGLLLDLPAYEAYSNLDAVLRTIVRMTLTHTKLLEWTTSSEATRTSRSERLTDIVRTMAVAPALALWLAIGLAFLRPEALATAAPWLVLWFISPLFAWWISRPEPRAHGRR